MLNNPFEKETYPGHARILFIGLAESSHTHSWVGLLDRAELNVRLFAMPSGAPPDSWNVRTYVTADYYPPSESASRAYLHPLPPPQPGNRWVRFAKRNWERFAKRSRARRRDARNAPRLPAEWLAQVIREWRPDIIHTLGLEPASYFYLEARERFGLQGLGKWVVQARGGPDLALHRLLPEYAPRIHKVLEQCDQFIADNQQNYEYALECGLKKECLSPLGVVPGTGGIDVDALAAKWDGPPSRRGLILWPKTYECPQSKALPVYEALKLVGERAGRFEIHMLAADSESRMWFQTLPEGLRRRCRFRERIPRAEALELMTRSRVMLAPSLSDGIPNSLYEAMAAGAFPIVSPLETIRPVVEHERNVLFARNLYAQEIAEALTRAMSDDALVDAAAARNLELVRRIADRPEVRARVVSFYERLAVEGQGGAQPARG